MKVKTADLIGPALDWAVAKCEGFNMEPWFKEKRVWLNDNRFSRDWAQGGPIIEREKISVEIKPHGYWMGSFQYNYAEEKEFLSLGPTPLVAAMLCYVASKLGDEVDVPEELTK